jgi:hypothetical protein
LRTRRKGRTRKRNSPPQSRKEICAHDVTVWLNRILPRFIRIYNGRMLWFEYQCNSRGRVYKQLDMRMAQRRQA